MFCTLVKEINAVFLWLLTGRNQNSNSVGKHNFSKVGMHPSFYDLFFCQFWHSLASMAELIQDVQCQKWERRHQVVNAEYADSICICMASVKSDCCLEIRATVFIPKACENVSGLNLLFLLRRQVFMVFLQHVSSTFLIFILHHIEASRFCLRYPYSWPSLS